MATKILVLDLIEPIITDTERYVTVLGVTESTIVLVGQDGKTEPMDRKLMLQVKANDKILLKDNNVIHKVVSTDSAAVPKTQTSVNRGCKPTALREKTV